MSTPFATYVEPVKVGSITVFHVEITMLQPYEGEETIFSEYFVSQQAADLVLELEMRRIAPLSQWHDCWYEGEDGAYTAAVIEIRTAD